MIGEVFCQSHHCDSLHKTAQGQQKWICWRWEKPTQGNGGNGGMLKAEEIIWAHQLVTVATVSCENMHTGNITDSEQAVFRNTMHIYKYMCVYIHIHAHNNSERRHHQYEREQRGRWEGLDGGNGREVMI